MKVLATPLLIPALLLLAACQPPSGDNSTAELILPPTEDAQPWTDVPVQDDPERFHFAIVSDRTGAARPGVFAGAMPKINLLEPAFVVSVGDLIEGYTDNQAQLDREWNEIESFVDQLDAPFFYTPGNHDMNNEVMANTWAQRFGPSYYHFLYKDVLFVVLNSELFGMVGSPDIPVPGPWKQSEQMHFIAQVLTQHPSPRWTIVLLHQPLWDTPEIDEDWLRVEELLGRRNYTVFAGHYHQYNLVQRNDRKFITLATTGGGSGLRGAAYGEFDQVAWVTMSEEGPQVANLVLDGILPDDVSGNTLRASLGDISSGLKVPVTLASTEQFAGGRQVVQISNPGDSPMTLSPGISRTSDFSISGLMPLTVAPGERVELPLTLSVPEPVSYRDLSPAAIDWTVTTTIGERPVQFVHRMPVLPLTRHTIRPVTTALTIDGDLTDWPALRFSVDRQGDILSREFDPEDLSFTFDVMADASFLYIAVDVVDDDVRHDPTKMPRVQDNIVLTVDPRGEAERERSMGIGEAVLGGDMAKIVMTMLTPGPAAEDKLLGFLADTNAVLKRSVLKTDTGYRAELAVPLSFVDERAGGAWQEVRIAVSVYDLDSGDLSPSTLHWQPYRYGDAAMPGSHRFVRQP